jgi:hypothetical protein
MDLENNSKFAVNERVTFLSDGHLVTGWVARIKSRGWWGRPKYLVSYPVHYIGIGDQEYTDNAADWVKERELIKTQQTNKHPGGGSK